MNYSVTILIINKDNKILSVSRKDNYNDWNLPGGKVEKNESFEEAIIRETKEETGLTVKNPIPIFSFYCTNGFFCITFISNQINGEIDYNIPNEGKISYKSSYEILKGSFGDYNSKLLNHIGFFNGVFCKRTK